MTEQDLKRWFQHHPPNERQIAQYAILRERGLELALTILKNCPAGSDTSAAIRKVREAVMTANAAIACDEAGRAHEKACALADPAKRDFTQPLAGDR